MSTGSDLTHDGTLKNALDTIRHQQNGKEYWYARELAAVLGYTDWDRFEGVVEKGRQAAIAVGSDPRHHFLGASKMVALGSGAERKVADVILSRYGCYLTAMNGDPRKLEVAAAQVYFAVQTRKQEIVEDIDQDAARIAARDRIKDHHKGLHSAAKRVGVHNYGLFNDAGIRGLYGNRGLTEVRKMKGLGDKEDLYDRAGHEELAANDFRITQTKAKLERDGASDEESARRIHNVVGRAVRQDIKEFGGTMPEDLPAEPSIKKLVRRQKKLLPPSHS